MLLSTLTVLITHALLGSAKTLKSRQAQSSLAAAPALYDGKCFYPQADVADFDLEQYLGRWYQVAGTAFGPTAGCKCVFAEYSLNVRESSMESRIAR
jgi:apolipoprotein D and lipocalin family protein